MQLKKKQILEFYLFSMNFWYLAEMMIKIEKKELLELDKRKKEEKEETIQVILNFFNLWGEPLIHYKNDFTEDEYKNGDSILEIDRKKKIQNIKIKNLEKAKIELESPEMEEICDENIKKKLKYCLELNLLKNLKKQNRINNLEITICISKRINTTGKNERKLLNKIKYFKKEK